MANTFQGAFPHNNTCEDGYAFTSPAGSFPANDYGLVDMIGNVWEWTSDWFSAQPGAGAKSPCCVSENPLGGREADSFDPALPQIRIPRKVLKGGSHMCAPAYCRRYRPAARHAQAIDSSMSHLGFRCIVRPQA
jgi:sulfatase modifying factor 1